MIKEIAIKNFVRKNYKLLIERSSFDRKKYDAIKKAYFGNELKLKFQIPRDKEICDCFVKIIIKAQKINEKELLEQVISEIPFLRINNIDSNNYIGEMELVGDKYAIRDEIDDLKGIEKVERLAEFIKKDKAKELDDLISKKQEEYRSLPSILDDYEFDEPIEIMQEEIDKEWWEKLNLRDNPFPALDGFFLIDESLYKEIVVETMPIVWALNKLKMEKFDIFHKGYLLGGDFGTGKTTFYDFIAPLITIKHIEPIRIALSENINVAHYIKSFEKEMCIEINKIAKNYSITTSSRLIDFEEAMVLMLDIQEKGAKGFFIFIDDLHKNIELKRVFDFLANLQIVKNKFSRNNINATFMVSGFPYWREKIRQDSSLTGFFDGADELTLPIVTPEIAAQAIKKRLKAFAINPEKELSVKEEFLHTIFKQVQYENKRDNVGFRPYIQEAVNKFQANKFDILSIDFTELEENIMIEIKGILEKNDDFKEGIDKLIYGGRIKKKEIREIALKVLCQIYLSNGISEDEDIFDSNRYYFKRLLECKLICKFNRNDKLVWKISPFLSELNKLIIDKYKLSMEDYLVPLYFIPKRKIKEKKGDYSKVDIYEKDLESWKGKLDNNTENNLNIVIKMYTEDILPFIEAGNNKHYNLLNPEKIKNCIWTLMKCIIRFESPLLLDICGESNIIGWTLRHRSLESSQHFIGIENSINKNRPEKADLMRLISFADDAFKELWNEFKTSFAIYQYCKVKCYHLPKETLKIIFSEYNNLFISSSSGEEYFQSLCEFIEKVEIVIRKYLLVGCYLIFGPYHVRIKYYPDYIRKYITKSMPSSSVSYESYNEFENLNRGQYRQIFTQINKDSEFYRYIIKPVIKNWDTHDVETFFQLFGDLNIIAGHTKMISVEDRKKDVPTFFRLACGIISDISTRLRELITKDNTVQNDKNKEINILFGISSEKINETEVIIPIFIYRHNIKSELESGCINNIIENSDNIYGDVEVNILDIEKTRIKFNIKYCHSIALISYILANYDRFRVRAITLYGTDIYLRKAQQ